MSRLIQISATQQLRIIRSDSEVFEVEASYAAGGQKPPPHLHPNHDERFHVLDGTLRALVDGHITELTSGERLTVLRGQVHTFWNESDEPAGVHWISAPAMQCDGWFTGLAALQTEATRTGRDVDAQAMAALAATHKDTFRPAPR